MNKQLHRLYEIAGKESRIILGLMSGTSLDGLDIACCKITGSGKETNIDLLHFETQQYGEAVRTLIRKIAFQQDAGLKNVSRFHKKIALLHATMVMDQLKKWNIQSTDIDLLASHGQTIFHAPSVNKTDDTGHHSFQAGDGDHLAHLTGIITLCDFRQKHIAAGGEGAPLAVYGDYLLYGNRAQNTVLLNIGGIANFTFLPANASFANVMCTDAGPGNTLMNRWCEQKFRQPFDEKGLIAERGKVDAELLSALNEHHFLGRALPASTGPEEFSIDWLNKCIHRIRHEIADEDVLATLNRYTAECILHSMKKCLPKEIDGQLLVSGGGCHNRTLMKHLKELTFAFSDKIRIDEAPHSDAKEAMIFALLANEAVAGNPSSSFGQSDNTSPVVSFGKICLPG